MTTVQGETPPGQALEYLQPIEFTLFPVWTRFRLHSRRMHAVYSIGKTNE